MSLTVDTSSKSLSLEPVTVGGSDKSNNSTIANVDKTTEVSKAILPAEKASTTTSLTTEEQTFSRIGRRRRRVTTSKTTKDNLSTGKDSMAKKDQGDSKSNKDSVLDFFERNPYYNERNPVTGEPRWGRVKNWKD